MAFGGNNIKQTLDWILGRLADEPKLDRVKLIDEASRKFDLSPLQADFLFSKLIEAVSEEK